MATADTTFQLGQELELTGKPMKVAGIAQFDDGSGQPITRYSLAGPAGAAVILQDDAGTISMLRPFPPAAAPTAEGSTVTVMGEKYTLAGVRKLKLTASAGDPPAGTPKAPLVLSGLFKGNMGTLLREVVPGVAAQSYFLVKPIGQGELLTGEELALRREAERVVAEMNAQAAESDAEETAQKPLAKIGGWIVAILVIAALVYACSGDDDSSSSSSSSGHTVRGSTSHGHGGK